MKSIYFLSRKDFLDIYSKVPRLTVDLVIKSSEGVLLALRDIVPWKGLWHLPGGTIYKGEKIADAALRIAKGETGLDVKLKKELGHIEYLTESRYKTTFHSLSIVFKAEPIGGDMRPDKNSKGLKYFEEMPENIIPQQAEFLKNKKILFN